MSDIKTCYAWQEREDLERRIADLECRLQEAERLCKEAVGQRDEMEKQCSKTRNEFFHDFVMDRGVEVACSKCGGLGVAGYGDTTTWGGGVGGQMVTSGVCDQCWGSGDANRPGADLRKVAKLKSRLAEARDALDACSAGNELGGAVLGEQREKLLEAEKDNVHLHDMIKRVGVELAEAYEQGCNYDYDRMGELVVNAINILDAKKPTKPSPCPVCERIRVWATELAAKGDSVKWSLICGTFAKAATKVLTILNAKEADDKTV